MTDYLFFALSRRSLAADWRIFTGASAGAAQLSAHYFALNVGLNQCA